MVVLAEVKDVQMRSSERSAFVAHLHNDVGYLDHHDVVERSYGGVFDSALSRLAVGNRGAGHTVTDVGIGWVRRAAEMRQV
jgi:hypothetical protein